jgi:hypothetical protein
MSNTNTTQEGQTPEQIINEMTEAFLRWPLPESVCADLCTTKQQPGRVGTNLLTFTEAHQMFTTVCGPTLAALRARCEVLDLGAKDLGEQLKLARARCAELGRDKELLDWLQAEHDAKVNIYPIMALVAKVRYVRDSHEWANLAPGSIRQAIDAARDAGKEAGK